MTFALDGDRTGRAVSVADAAGLSIGLVNNMPDAALDATERQFSALLQAAMPDAAVRLSLFAIPELPRGENARRTLARKYRDIAELWDRPLDGLIVTGAEPRAADLRDEPFWPTLRRLVDWAKANTHSTIWSCLAAHAAVLHADGIERKPLGAKRSGVFACRVTADHPMTQHFPDPLWLPHSRYNDLPEAALTACGYRILTRSATAGVDAFARQGGSFFLFFQGHPEYEADTLLREYRRDAARFLGGERPHFPELPTFYFGAAATAEAEAFRSRALTDRRADLMTEFPMRALEAGLTMPWRQAALGFYQKWLAFLRARKAERRVGLPLRRTWRDWPASLRPV